MIGKPIHKTEVDYQLAGLGKTELVTDFTFIPTNVHGVRAGYYDGSAIVKLLRSVSRQIQFKMKWNALEVGRHAQRLRFIADMME